jgi:hypothetical protein
MRPIFQGWNNYSQLSFYFPILPIFKENLNRQGMALKPPRGDLVKMAFKVFNNQDKARYQQKAQLLAAALRLPPPTSRWAGQQYTPPGLASNATICNTVQNTALHLASHQNLVHNVARIDTGG